MPAPAPDRRPLRTRETAWANAVAGRLARRGVSPNAISLAGLAAALVAGGAFAATAHTGELAGRLCFAAGAALCQLRLLANLLDGMVAIGSGRTSPVGEMMNEIPDRLSDSAVFIGLGYAAGSEPVLGYGAALAAVFVAYVRAAAAHADAPHDFCGPMAKPQRMALVTAAALVLALSPAGWLDEAPVARIVLGAVIAGGLITAARRLIRAARALARARP